MTKIECTECRFGNSSNKDEEAIKLGGQEIPKNERFQYLRLKIHEN